jgi:hypothetical protein
VRPSSRLRDLLCSSSGNSSTGSTISSTACVSSTRRQVVAAATASDDAAGSHKYHILPSEADGQAAIAAFSAAAAAAEAAQQQLLSGSSSNPLSELLAADEQLRSVSDAYSTVQSLHHEAVLQKLQQYGPSAASLPGFAYACASEALGDEWAAQPNEEVWLVDLHAVRILLERQQPSSNSTQAALISMALDLIKACSCGSGRLLLDDLLLLVLPDLRTLLLECISPAAVEAAAGAHLPSVARQQLEWVDLAASSAGDLGSARLETAYFPPLSQGSWDGSISEQLVADLLQQGQQQHTAAADSKQQPLRLSNLQHTIGQLHQLGDR